MEPREQRGLIIAALCKLTRKGQAWEVPSQTVSDRKYVVSLETGSCTCPAAILVRSRRNCSNNSARMVLAAAIGLPYGA